MAYNFVSQQQMKEVNGDDDKDDDDGYNYDHNLTMILLIVRRIDLLCQQSRSWSLKRILHMTLLLDQFRW